MSPKKRAIEPGEQSRERQSEPATQGVRPRRRPMLIAVGIATIVVCGLGTFYWVNASSNTVSVLTTSGAVARGDTLEIADFGTMQISSGQATNAIPAEQAETLVGQVATVDLPAGSLVTADNVAATVDAEAGMAVVGLPVSVTQLPNSPLRAGDTVQVVFTPPSQGEAPLGAPPIITATVHTVREAETKDLTIVDVVVPVDEASTLAAWAATGRIALVIDSSGGA